jgi:hypothetical protein
MSIFGSDMLFGQVPGDFGWFVVVVGGNRGLPAKFRQSEAISGVGSVGRGGNRPFGAFPTVPGPGQLAV